MPSYGFPTRLIIDGKAYKIAGENERTPRWQVSSEASQPGEFQSLRIVNLGDGAAGIIGSRRYSGWPSPQGVADVTNGDTSFENRYGAGPKVTTTALSTGDSYHDAGGIGETLVIGGGGGEPSIGGAAVTGTPTMIWADGLDSDQRSVRYIYCIAGGRIKVIDPTTDAVVHTVEYGDADGGDSAKWAGTRWIAMRGGASRNVEYVTIPYSSTTPLSTAPTDYTATSIHAGPDALYRAYSDFAGNEALVKKSDVTTKAGVAQDANWAPSSGETMGEPSAAITNLSTLGERLVVGKVDGLGELDKDFTYRHYLEWMAAFESDENCNVIIPIGSAGEVIVGFRRGLYYLPLNKAIGTEVLTGNESDKKGRYLAGTFDGNWFYFFIESLETDDTHLIKMRPRRSPGPGLFEHHPIATFTDTKVLTAYIWPGAQIGSTFYGPRLYFGYGTGYIAYIRLGETQPDQSDSNYRFTTGDWSIEWPLDDFESPTTLKMPYKVEANYENVQSTTGITWSVSTDGETFDELTSDGITPGSPEVFTDGFHQRFGPSNNSIRGRALAFKMSGTGGSTTAQQRINGQPIVYVIEQPEMVQVYRATLQLESLPENGDDAEAQWRTLSELQGQGPRKIIVNWGDNAPDTTVYGFIPSATRPSTIAASGGPGVIIAEVVIRALDFTDESST